MNIKETGRVGVLGGSNGAAAQAAAMAAESHRGIVELGEAFSGAADAADDFADAVRTLKDGTDSLAKRCKPLPPGVRALAPEGSVEADEILFRRRVNKRRRAAKAAKLARRRNRK